MYKCLSLTPNVTPHSSHPVHASSGKAENKIYSKPSPPSPPSPPSLSCKRSTNNINWNVPLIWHLWSGRKKSDQTSRNVKSFEGIPLLCNLAVALELELEQPLARRRVHVQMPNTSVKLNENKLPLHVRQSLRRCQSAASPVSHSVGGSDNPRKWKHPLVCPTAAICCRRSETNLHSLRSHFII